MPDQTQHPDDALLLHVADQIAPLFETNGAGKASARDAALSALAAYHPESRADFVNIARILAFSVASLVALGLAAAADLTPVQKMRFFGRANALNRSANQTERLMMQRRRDQRGQAPAERPGSPRNAAPKPDDPAFDAAPYAAPDAAIDAAPGAVPDAIIDAAIEEAMAAYRAIKPTQQAAQPPAAETRTSGLLPAWAETTIRTTIPTPHPTARQTLLQGSAMPRVLDGTPRYSAA